jgi:SprT-like family
MQCELPSITYQRRKLFRPGPAEIVYTYDIINKHLFHNKLRRPDITVGRVNRAWGVCQWHWVEQDSGSYCDLWIADKWYCPQWFVNTLAHEMVHQWQWDINRWEHIDYYGRDIHQNSGGHGPSFFAWRDEFEYYGLNLKGWFRMKKWFKYQDFRKC